MAHCDRNLAAELVLDFLRRPAETTCGHLAVYDNIFWRILDGKIQTTEQEVLEAEGEMDAVQKMRMSSM